MNRYQEALNGIKDTVIDEQADGEKQPRTVADYCFIYVGILQELVDKYALEEDISKRVQKEKLNGKQKERWIDEYCKNEQNPEYGWCQFDE